MTQKNSLLQLATIFFAFTLFRNFALAQEKPFWREYVPGLELAQIEEASSGPQLTLFRSSLSRFRPAVIRAAEFGLKRTRVSTLCRESKASLCINANFFDEHGEALGLVISKGVAYKQVHQGGNTLSGIFQVTRKDFSIVNRKNFNQTTVLEAVQAGPRLIHGGKPVPGLRDSSRARRSGVCKDEKQRLILFAVPSSILGLTTEELQSLLLRPEINCAQALNFDGGGSTQLFVNAKPSDPQLLPQALNIEGYDDVPVALGIFEVV